MDNEKKTEQIVTLEKLRDELVVVAQQVKKGVISPNTGNAVINGLRSAGYIELGRLQQEKGQAVKLEQSGELELSQEDKDRLDDIAVLLAGGTPKKRRKSKNDKKQS